MLNPSHVNAVTAVFAAFVDHGLTPAQAMIVCDGVAHACAAGVHLGESMADVAAHHLKIVAELDREDTHGLVQ